MTGKWAGDKPAVRKKGKTLLEFEIEDGLNKADLGWWSFMQITTK